MEDYTKLSPLALAFIGDSVHTLYVREHIVMNDVLKINDYHKLSSHFCKAETQSKVLDQIAPMLSEQEKEVVRKARNTKIHHNAKNASVKDYKQATSFEALLGYLYVTNQNDRLQEILKLSMGENI